MGVIQLDFRPFFLALWGFQIFPLFTLISLYFQNERKKVQEKKIEMNFWIEFVSFVMFVVLYWIGYIIWLLAFTFLLPETSGLAVFFVNIPIVFTPLLLGYIKVFREYKSVKRFTKVTIKSISIFGIATVIGIPLYYDLIFLLGGLVVFTPIYVWLQRVTYTEF